jgi:signal-transduction protein with cAMP-binding, CBS, and nucleotidyltransferase domain
MSRPVHAVTADSFVYTALARMDRLHVRHLAVTDGEGRLIGALSARALLKLRAGEALVIGDEIATAADAGDLRDAIRQLPPLARALRADGASAGAVAAVISGVMRDATARACELAEIEMAAAGKGGPPAPYAMLVLGSSGRGESLLAPDQDNAIVHAGGATDDPWYAEIGRRTSHILDAAGIPYCKGKVMASEPPWRRPRGEWMKQVDEWLRHSRPEDLLNVDIFFDFRVVHGDASLAAELREMATRHAQATPPFLKLLAVRLDELNAPFGLFGGIRSEKGRVDLKRGGLLPLVSGARIMALACGHPGTATSERFRAAAAAHALRVADAAAFVESYETILAAVLDQQLADISVKVPPSSRVALKRLDRRQRTRLSEALRTVETLKLAVRDVLTAGHP